MCTLHIYRGSDENSSQHSWNGTAEHIVLCLCLWYSSALPLVGEYGGKMENNIDMNENDS